MLFTFKRDDEGRERIYVGNVCVAELVDQTREHGWETGLEARGVTVDHIDEAIERADEAGFWDWDHLRNHRPFVKNEVTVDVPVADNAVLSVTMWGDES